MVIEEEKLLKIFKTINKIKNSNLKVNIKEQYLNSYYTNIFQIEINLIENDKEKYIIVFCKRYGELNEIIDNLDINSNYFYSLINLIEHPVFLKNTEKKYIIINKSFENLFNLSKKDVINKTDLEIFSLKEAKDYSKSDQYVIEQKITVSEIHWKKFENNLLCFNTIKSPIFSDSKKVIGLIGISKDITADRIKILEQKYNLQLYTIIENMMYKLFESIDLEKTLNYYLKSLSETLNLTSILFYFKDPDSKNYLNLLYFINNKKGAIKLKIKKRINIKNLYSEIYEKITKEKFCTFNHTSFTFFKPFLDIEYEEIKKKNIELTIFPVVQNNDLKSLIVFVKFKNKFPQYFKGDIEDYNKYFDLSISQKKSLSILFYFLYNFIEKRKKEKLLKEYSYNLELIQQTIPISFWVEDLLTKEIIFSKYLYDLIKISKKKKLSREIILSSIDPKAKRKLKRFYYKLNKQRFAQIIIHIFYNKNDKKILSFSGQKFENKLIVVVLDITRQKLIEEELLKNIKELEKAKKSVEDADKSKSNYLAFLSHELRNMLTAIGGISSILIERLKDKEEKKFAISINQNTNQILELINNILDFSKLESKEVELNKKLFSIRYLVDKIEEYFYLISLEKGLIFNIIVDHNVEDIVYLDQLRVNQILMNLITNSIKFTSKGFVKLSVYQFYDNILKISKIVFCIEDSGIGISNENIDKIFNPFVQEDKTIYTKYGGTGLGLSIVKKLVDTMNGKISVKSKKGSGSSFTIELPLNNYNQDIKEDEIEFLKKLDDRNENYANKINLINQLKKSFEIHKNLNQKDKLVFDILISIEDQYLSSKIISLLEYLKINYISFDLSKNYVNLNKITLSNSKNIFDFKNFINDYKNKRILACFLDKYSFQYFKDHKDSCIKFIFDINEIRIANEYLDLNQFSLNAPFTYDKLFDLIIFIFQNNIKSVDTI
ncbi:MAG: ATP-binding protein [Exilispira sp.]